MPTDFERLRALQESNPQEFLKLMRQVDSKTVYPHEHQLPIVNSRARFKVLNCGRRFGKTVIAAKIIVSKSRKPKQMLWWVAPQYRIVKRGYEEILRQLPDGVLSHDPPPSTNFDAGRPIVLRFKNGTRMEFYSSERPEGMLGAAVDYAVLDEAARMSGTIWNQTVSPTLIDHKGGALMLSTPRGRNWFYDVWLKGQDPEQTEWESWTFTTQDNPTLPEGEADRMAADIPQTEADQEIFAKWLAAGSSVFLLDDAAIQRARVMPNYLVDGCAPEGSHVFLGVDLARTHDFTVLYGTRERDRKNVYFERMQTVAWPEQRRRIRRAVGTLMKAGASAVTLMVDEGNAGTVIVEDLQEQGFDVVGINFTTHKANMVRLLANDLSQAKAFVLEEKLDEFQDYAMDQTPAGRITYSAPEGRHDDVVSAKMLAHWGCVNEGFGDIKMISASDPSGPSNADMERDPWDEDMGDTDFSDLIDTDETLEDIGLRPSRPPTEHELLTNPDVWLR